MISIGKRDRRVTVLMSQTTREVAGSGGSVTTYVPRFSKPLHATVSGASGREVMAAGQNIARWEHKITVLFNSSISRNDKIEYNGERYEIVAMSEIGRRECLEILVTRDLK